MSKSDGNTPEDEEPAQRAEERSPAGRRKRRLRRKYTQIDSKRRQELLLAIDESRSSIKSISHRLGINYSTAKNIVKIYRKENRIEKLPKHPARPRQTAQDPGEGKERHVIPLEEKKDAPLPRFIAKKCPLFVKEKLKDTASHDEQNAESEKSHPPKRICFVGRGEDIYHDYARPIFDFQAYSSIILEMYDKYNYDAIGLPTNHPRARTSPRLKDESCLRPSSSTEASIFILWGCTAHSAYIILYTSASITTLYD
ncbi:MAG: helix-turn-helix domain-containing protein [Candidatus Pacebacteria bacterium]|nr:helix-turn-helix domain-containing protein [Candidatus Paceibacterota bacterium]